MKNYTFKIVLMGDSSVGKTSIASRVVRNSFSNFQESTIGAAFMTKIFDLNNEKIIKYEIWDTAGQERYRALAPMYYRGADCILLVFDLTNKESFTNINNWLSEIKRMTRNNPLIIIVGNKLDLERERQIKNDFIMEYVNSQGVKYYEVSAKENENIEKVIEYINIILPETTEKRLSKEREQRDALKITQNYSEKRKFKCC